ncbi:MAG: ATP-dependent Clp protease adaptor ClpS [Anaerolineales bacterium]|nr:ATP-dependent Clp protease adaptor ClpS [Anaerolineales bacterium]
MTDLIRFQASMAVSQPDVAKEQLIEKDEALEKRWKIIAHDDPVTTMEFVVRIMVQIFKKPVVFAEAIMWQVHNEGLSVVDVLPKSEAELRVRKATMAARLEGFPFRFTLEPE